MNVSQLFPNLAAQMGALNAFSVVENAQEFAQAWPSVQSDFIEPNRINEKRFGTIPTADSSYAEIIMFREHVLERVHPVIDSRARIFIKHADYPLTSECLEKYGFKSAREMAIKVDKARKIEIISHNKASVMVMSALRLAQEEETAGGLDALWSRYGDGKEVEKGRAGAIIKGGIPILMMAGPLAYFFTSVAMDRPITMGPAIAGVCLMFAGLSLEMFIHCLDFMKDDV